MNIVAISDTHSKHEQFEINCPLPDADMILHSGDCTMSGRISEVNKFLEWYSCLPYQYKILIAGNHDWFFQREECLSKQMCRDLGIIYLFDSEVILEGIKFYGSPWQPEFNNWAFNKDRGENIARIWDAIPEDTDVLITHGPAYNILDKNSDNTSVGCKDLLKRISEIRPKYHIFGHIHEGYGMVETKDTTFFNASSCNKFYNPVNDPIFFEIS